MWMIAYKEKNKAEHLQRFMTGNDLDGRGVAKLEVTLHESDILYIGKCYEGSFLQAVDDPRFPKSIGYMFINGNVTGSHGRPQTDLSPHDHPTELTDQMMAYLAELVDTYPAIEDNLTKCMTELSQPGRYNPDRNK